MIFKESVNNLVKHSCCTRADIEFNLAEDSLLLSVADNGKGFDATQDGQGHGLASIRERAGSLGGKLHLVSIPGEGTSITLIVQLGQH